jgi:hypothetical protein
LSVFSSHRGDGHIEELGRFRLRDPLTLGGKKFTDGKKRYIPGRSISSNSRMDVALVSSDDRQNPLELSR